jgi:hypothetical protein
MPKDDMTHRSPALVLLVALLALAAGAVALVVVSLLAGSVL